MLVALDVGFGYTKTVTAAGVDVSPSVVGEWTPRAFRLAADLGGGRDTREPEAVALDGRAYVVGERTLRIAHRRFMGLSREWMAHPTFRVLALAALHRVLGGSGHTVTLVTQACPWRTSSRMATRSGVTSRVLARCGSSRSAGAAP